MGSGRVARQGTARRVYARTVAGPAGLCPVLWVLACKRRRGMARLPRDAAVSARQWLTRGSRRPARVRPDSAAARADGVLGHRDTGRSARERTSDAPVAEFLVEGTAAGSVVTSRRASEPRTAKDAGRMGNAIHLGRPC
jgi:hypothetical protein